MLDFIQSIDVKILLFFNQSLQSDFLDILFPYFTNLHKIFWVKAFVFPLLGALWFYKSRSVAFRVLLALAITGGISDTLGYRFLKPTIQRVRPNNNPQVSSQIRTLRNPQSHSFPSNHSMNSFAVGTVAVIYYPYLAWIIYPIATVVAMFRVYAGVHYPTDVLFGALMGLALGFLLQKYIFQRISFFKKG